tara:strand:- start:2379 stop:2588 length:210 start_codon:yes stop_codon:yes gene_type:complete
MTKFSDEFIDEVQDYWKDNKGKFTGKAETGTHKKRIVEKKFGCQDLADHFNLTFAQANRIIYVKNGGKK